jgi:alpha-ketoglutaric semialdehyde dehydrogenase
MTGVAPILLAGAWQPSREQLDTIGATDPATREPLPERYPVSGRADVVAALEAGHEAAQALHAVEPNRVAHCLERFAELIEAHRRDVTALAQLETALPEEPRLNSVELPRTTDQLRQAARAVRERSWTQPVIDTGANIRSLYGPLGGPVVVFGPNNFPLAFNSVSGGDFAAALAAGNPVIAKANPGHPGTTRLLAEFAFKAVIDAGLPEATVQLLYHLPPELGLELVSHPLVGATGFTGSRRAGLELKEAADRAGKPIYLRGERIFT